MGIIALLKEERSYWVDVKENSNNRLVQRVANNNIQKCCDRIFKLTHNIRVY